MAYIKGIIPKDKVPLFLEFLGNNGYAFRHSTVRYELGQVLIVGRWMAITVDAKDVVGLPEDLVPHAQDFLRGTFTPPCITDTQRLDFLLGGPTRKVVKEIEGYNGAGELHYAIYVQEGEFGGREYPALRFTQADRIAWNKGEDLDKQRQAIDLAINEPVSVSKQA